MGRPIAHSLSPLLHTAAYTALGLDWHYEAIECGAEELGAVIDARADWAGFSCTMPCKHAALAAADEASDRAAAIGAANTLVPRPGGGWRAENTDVDGVLGALAEHAITPRSVTVLGAGGTAQAVLAAVAAVGLTECGVLVRDVARGTALAATAERLGIALALARWGGDAPGEANGAMDEPVQLDADLVISTLPSGAADALADRPWRPDQVVFDVAYDPWPSALAEGVRRAGGTVISGGLMLLHQAAVQVQLMTGQAPPLEAMREALATRIALS